MLRSPCPRGCPQDRKFQGINVVRLPDKPQARQEWYNSTRYKKVREIVKRRAHGFCELRLTESCLPDAPGLGKHCHHVRRALDCTYDQFCSPANICFACPECHKLADRVMQNARKRARIFWW